MSDAKNKIVDELNSEFQTVLEKALETHDVEIIGRFVMLMMGHVLQTIMLINFRKAGYLTNVEQGEIVDDIVHKMLRATYPKCVDQVNELHAEWFEKKPPITRH